MKIEYKIAFFIPLAFLLSWGMKTVLPQPLNNKAYSDYIWVKKTHGNERYNVLVAGDSRMYKGANPSIILKDNKELTGFNLGFSSTGFSLEYLDFVSERLKKEGVRVVLCGITPYSFTPQALKNEHYHSFLEKDSKEVAKILNLSWFMNYFPIYSPLEIKAHFFPDSIRYEYAHEFKENGWVKSYKLPFDSTHALPSYRENFNENFADSSAILNYLNWVKEKTAEKVIIFGFRPPSTLAMEQLEDSLSGFKYADFSTKFKENGGIWLDFSLKGYKSYDGSHLDFESSTLFSERLGSKIKPYLEPEFDSK